MMPIFMQKVPKAAMIFLITIFLIGGGIYLFLVVSKLSQKISFQEEEIRSKLGQLNEKIDRLQLSVDRMGNAYQGLSGELVKLERDHGLMSTRVEHFSGVVDEVKASTGIQMKGLMKLVNDLQDQSKQWIKESVATFALFESNLDLNNKDVTDLISNKLPELGQKLSDLKDLQQADRVTLQAVQTKTTNLSILEGKMVDLENKLLTLQEQTLDVILKSDVLRKF